MSKKSIKLSTNRVFKGSVRFQLAEDGSLEQILKVFQPSSEPQSVPVFRTKYGQLRISKHTLTATITFNRDRLSYDDIVQLFYSETDEIADYISTHQAEIREAARAAYTDKAPVVQLINEEEAA